MEFNLAHPSPGNWEEVGKDNISLEHMDSKKPSVNYNVKELLLSSAEGKS